MGLICFLPLQINAQIKVIDSLTKLPLQGVTLTVDNSTVVQITNEVGEFDVTAIKTGTLLAFTSIGYQKRTIALNKISAVDSIFLTPVTYQLNEVSIGKKRYRNHLTGGKMSLFYGSNSYAGYSYEEARFFPNDNYNKGSKIIAVQYFVIKKQSFQKKFNVNLSNAFGVGVYEANADGSPGKPILLDALVVMAKAHAQWFEVNLEQYNLEMPKYGFVVGFKVFSALFYGVKDAKVNSDNFVAPTLAIKTYLKKSHDSWTRGLYAKSTWRRETFSHFGIRAMVAEAK